MPNQLSKSCLLYPLALICLIICCSPAWAQDEDLREKLDRMEQVIQQQQADLDKQRAQLAEQLELIRQLQDQQQTSLVAPASNPEPRPPLIYADQDAGTTDQAVAGAEGEKAVTSPDATDAAEAELARRQQNPMDSEQEAAAVAATLYDPSNTIYDKDFPGAWHLPGTTAAMRIGGYVNLAVVSSFDPMLISDRFIVGSIPPEGQDVTGAKSGTEVTANQTRVNMEVRDQTSQGLLRAFIEGDFEGKGSTFRLRHAFGQFNSVLAGKTWSTFMDVDSRPEEVDFEGINGEVLVRQSQLRWSPDLGKDFQLKISLEDPQTDIVNGSGAKGNPDMIASVNRLPLGQLGDWNYRVGFILRDLEGTTVRSGGENPEESTDVVNTIGWGFTTSGRKSFSRMGDNDALLWQVTYGKGIGRYLNDLSTMGGGDAVFDPNGKLRALPVLAGYLSYRHQWPMRWQFMNDFPGLLRSNFTLSWVNIKNYDFQDDKDYNSTLRASANLL